LALRCILATAMSIPGYRSIKMQKVSISSYCLPQNSKKVRIIVFLPNAWYIQTFVLLKRLMPCSKIEFLKSLIRQAAAMWKKVKWDIFANVWPFLMKFGMATHIRLPKLISDHKFQNFQNPTWQMVAFSKIEKKSSAQPFAWC